MTTDTLTITDFLLARIAEDERRYRADKSEYGYGWKHMLAECEAKRRIVELHDWRLGYNDTAGDPDCPGCSEQLPCSTLKAVASVYADHADYRDEWR